MTVRRHAVHGGAARRLMSIRAGRVLEYEQAAAFGRFAGEPFAGGAGAGSSFWMTPTMS